MFTVLGGMVGFSVDAFMVGPAVAIMTLGLGIPLYPLIVVLSTIGGMAIGSIMDLAALSTLIAVVVAPLVAVVAVPLLLIGGTAVVGVAAVAGLVGVIAVPAAAGLCAVSAFVLPLVALGLCGLGTLVGLGLPLSLCVISAPALLGALPPVLAGIADITGTVGP
jgi:hypothetical protein